MGFWIVLPPSLLLSLIRPSPLQILHIYSRGGKRNSLKSIILFWIFPAFIFYHCIEKESFVWIIVPFSCTVCTLMCIEITPHHPVGHTWLVVATIQMARYSTCRHPSFFTYILPGASNSFFEPVWVFSCSKFRGKYLFSREMQCSGNFGAFFL